MATKRLANGEPKSDSRVAIIDLTGDSDSESSTKSRRPDSTLGAATRPQLPPQGVLHTTTANLVKSTPAQPRPPSHSPSSLAKTPFKNRPSWASPRDTTVAKALGASSSPRPPALVPPASSTNGSLEKALSTDPSTAASIPVFRVPREPPIRFATQPQLKTSPPPSTPTRDHVPKAQKPSVAVPRRPSQSSNLAPVASYPKKVPHVTSDVLWPPPSARPGTEKETVKHSFKQTPEQISNSARNIPETISSYVQTRSRRPSRLHTPKHETPPGTPIKTPASTISVVIDNRHRQASDDLSAEDLLTSFRRRLPDASKKTSALVEELKKSTLLVTQSRASSVEAIIGKHGLSTFFLDDDDEKFRKLAQPKVKKVDRASVPLHFGKPTVLPSQSALNLGALYSPKQQAREILGSRFMVAQHPPVTFVNELNEKQLDGKFEFVTAYVKREGVTVVPQASNIGCGCHGKCVPDSCGCFNDNDEEDDFGDVTHHGKIVPYILRADGLVVLRDDFISGGIRSEIVECNAFCGCGPTCWNRVVQRGRTLPLEIFMTEKCGFGLRSPLPIVKGQFIELYLGELITNEQVEQREIAREEQASSYVFSLDWFTITPIYHVDGIHFGTATRFINHSCNPNCQSYTVMNNRSDERVYNQGFFAIRDIPAMTELTFDYNPQEAGKKYPLPKEGDSDDNAVLCQCGEENCRIRLWPGKKKRKGRGWAKI